MKILVNWDSWVRGEVSSEMKKRREERGNVPEAVAEQDILLHFFKMNVHLCLKSIEVIP